VFPTNLYINKKFWELLIVYFPWYDTGHIENDESNNSSIVACVFVTAVTFLPSRCLATIRGFLPRRCQATIGGIHRHRQQRNLISLLFLFLNKKSMLKSDDFPTKQNWPSPSAEVNNTWSYTSTPPYDFKAWFLYKQNHTFHLYISKYNFPISTDCIRIIFIWNI
jgi:hypothetical protein